MTGNDIDTFDLLGLDAAEHSPVLQQSPLKGASAGAASSKPPSPAKEQPAAVVLSEPVIAYPSAYESSVGKSGYISSSPSVGCAGNGTDGGMTSTQQGQTFTGPQIRFSVRCEGRWRVRSAPSLSSKVVGTIANGTTVIGETAQSEFLTSSGSVHLQMPGTTSLNAPTFDDGTGLKSLWVRVHRFETDDPSGVSEIRRDIASGGILYCLRRNALGYGLYEVGVEPLEGDLLNLPENLAAELRFDAQRAATDKSEDVSLTWKILGAAESFGRLFNSMSSGIVDEGGVNEDMKGQVRHRPDEVFETKQKEQLKKAATALKKATQNILLKAGTYEGDVLEGLPKEINRRFARMRSQLGSSAETSTPLVSMPQQECESSPTAKSATASFESQQSETSVEKLPSGTPAELTKFIDLCERLERTGGWPELSSALRQEVTNFSTKHVQELEQHAKRLAKDGLGKDQMSAENSPSTPTSPVAPQNDWEKGPLFIDFKTTPAASPSRPVASNGKGFVPLLPPPPAPSSGIKTAKLI